MRVWRAAAGVEAGGRDTTGERGDARRRAEAAGRVKTAGSGAAGARVGGARAAAGGRGERTEVVDRLDHAATLRRGVAVRQGSRHLRGLKSG